jgi:hypothetical protein
LPGWRPGWGRRSGADVPLATTTCNVTGTVSFSPAITNVTQTTVSNVYTQVKLANCSGGVSSAKIKGALSGPASCKKDSAKGTLTFTWNTGDKSKVKLRSHAQAVRICHVSGQVKFSPALGQTTQTTDHIYKNASTKVKSCALNTSTGTFAGTLTGQRSCSKASAEGTWTFAWGQGANSKASISFKTLGGGKAKITGRVTSGQLKGSSVSGTLAYTIVRGSCSSGPGVSLASFKGKLAI